MKRLDRMISALKQHELDGLFVLKEANIRYLSGFTNKDCYVLVSETCRALIGDTRYTEQAAMEVQAMGFEAVPWRTPHPPIEDVVLALCQQHGIKRLGYESDRLSCALHDRIYPKLQAHDIEFISTGGLNKDLKPAECIVDLLRYIRDEEEIALTRKACEISDKGLALTLEKFRYGMTAGEFSQILKDTLMELGSDPSTGAAWPLTGKLTSVPHGHVGNVTIEKGDFLLIDFGAQVQGYKCDMTRTFVVGKADAKQRRIYEVVRKTQETALSIIKAGIPAWIPDLVARQVIFNSEFKDYAFTYGVSHGCGLEVHEIPFMFPGNEQLLAAGNIVAFEPGVYIPNYGGFRLEDMVMIKESGYEYMTHFSRDLIEL